jgi:hypothetical protein
MADLGWSHDGRLVGRINLGHDLVDRARLALAGFTARISKPSPRRTARARTARAPHVWLR